MIVVIGVIIFLINLKEDIMIMPKYTEYYVDDELVITKQGKQIKVLELKPNNEDDAIEEWARHLRRHYINDGELIDLSEIMGIPNNQVLSNLIFPDPSDKFGKSTMVGDFTEIMIADYLQYVNDYVVPRTRYNHKDKRNRSTQGSDLIAYSMENHSVSSLHDELRVYEVKAQSSDSLPKLKLQEAINDSEKDFTRLAESMVTSCRRLLATDRKADAKIVARFLNDTDRPYQTIHGAAAVHSDKSYSKDLLKDVDVSMFSKQGIELIVIHCNQLLSFILQMYERASKC